MSSTENDRTLKHRTPRAGRLSFALRTLLATGVTLICLPPAVAWAEPPPALPESATAADARWQPAFDYDTDGCYPTPAIGSNGSIADGLDPTGALNGNCRDRSDLENTNAYARSTCNNGWCAYLYDLYFEKDQAVPGWDAFGHRHDIEHVVVWVNQERDQAQYVSTSAHGDYDTKRRSEVRWEGTHAKVVYHKDGAGTHAFRHATADDEPPENHDGAWQYPDLVSWNRFPDGIRQTLVSADFGSASLAISDGAFQQNLENAKPSDIPFDPYAGAP